MRPLLRLALMVASGLCFLGQTQVHGAAIAGPHAISGGVAWAANEETASPISSLPEVSNRTGSPESGMGGSSSPSGSTSMVGMVATGIHAIADLPLVDVVWMLTPLRSSGLPRSLLRPPCAYQ